MLINGVDLSSLGVQLYNRVLTSNNIRTTRDWLEGDIQPTFIRQQEKFKTIQLQFLITEKNEDDAFLVMSKLTAMLKKATVVFDDIDLLFDMTITGPTQQKRLKNGNFILTVDLVSDYAKGQNEVYTTNQQATNYFKLRLLYYQNGNVLISTDEVVIRSSDFDLVNTYTSLGIDLNKYKPDYYNSGQVTNFSGLELTYENLYAIQTLIINYSPVVYSKEVEYFVKNQEGILEPTQTSVVTFTKAQVDAARNLGELIDFNQFKPNGYYASTNFTEEFNFTNLLNFSPLQIYFEEVENDVSKNITVTYYKQNNIGEYEVTGSAVTVVKQSDVVLGARLKNFINLNRYKPTNHYDSGYIKTDDYEMSVTYATLKTAYDVYYDLTEYTVFAEYYYGSYPNWHRITTSTYQFKYDDAYENSVDIISDLGIDINKYKTETYNSGLVYQANIVTFDDVTNTGILQIYYVPKDYDLTIEYLNDEEQVIQTSTISINEIMFFNEPSLANIININAARPEGYIFDESKSYNGEVTLGSLLANAPIQIYYKEVEAVRTKSIVLRYKQELASTFSTINTSIITIEEAQVGGGVRLGDLFDLNAYRPQYYDNGILNGVSAASIFTFDEIQGEYNILYMASQYSTQVRYYTDEIENENWIGSEQLKYTVLDFNVDTTLVDLGLDINLFKPAYCSDGEIQYTGAISFSALRNLDAINIVYNSVEEPEDPDGIDYPHRILFLQHNDMGNFEPSFPNWTLNHAFINTGVTCSDMSKLTVLVDTYRVFEATAPLYDVNVNDAYLFGSITPNGSYYIKYVNNTKYKNTNELTGINTFNVAAGLGTPELVVEESSSEGFSANTGITASTRDGYSYGTLTFTHLVESNSARMDVPLYLFACNMNGYYRGGIAGVGIKSCKIYYDNVLIRDFVPVTFYDKIGDKIAPSNCLYDKVTQNFFEDGTGLNSFNIMDDPDYEDTNPEHNLGCCYANYYQDGVLFTSIATWFRESDFLGENSWDPYTKLLVDHYQPKYANAGVITNLDQLGEISFNNVKNFIFIINYVTTDYHFVVRYWNNDTSSEDNLIAEEELTINERNFYSVPTFGDIVDLQKYKTTGYKPTYNYPETKVTLSRILEHAPYDIVYQEVENPEIYTTTVKYYRKHYTTNSTLFTANWLEIGTREVEIDETQFAEGVYVEKFLDLNAFKPVSAVQGVEFYGNGAPYNWYLQDEMLDTPEKLKSQYQVVYNTISVPIEIRYYTDQVDQDNLVASSVWNIKLSDWPDGEMFYLTDELPNKFINAYKPVICWGGELQNSSQQYIVQSLAELGHIDIVYRTKEEPHDPDSTDFPQKVLWFKKDSKNWRHLPTYIPGFQGSSGSLDEDADELGSTPCERNIDTPYLNLGYTPKEIGRLRCELKGYCGNAGIGGVTSTWSYDGSSDFSPFFGYVSAAAATDIYKAQGQGDGRSEVIALVTKEPSIGRFAYQGHTIGCGGIIYTSPGPQNYDGHAGFNLNTNAMNNGYDLESVREMSLQFRRGVKNIKDIDLNTVTIYPDYMQRLASGYGVYDDLWYHEHADPNGSAWRTPVENPVWGELQGDGTYVYHPGVSFNPITGIIDAYNGYFEMYDYETSNNPEIKTTLENKDTDIFEYRGKPKGPLTLFVTTNPNTGTLNWLPTPSVAYLPISTTTLGALPIGLLITGQNPYDSDFSSTFVYKTLVAIDNTGNGTLIWQEKDVAKSLSYANFTFNGCPVPCRSIIWYIKLWDRNKLIRDLIPVAAGDQIYDFIAPSNGLFDKVTEIFFANENEGGNYLIPAFDTRGKYVGDRNITLTADKVKPLYCSPDPTIWGKVIVNYYDDKNNFLGNQYVTIPVHYNEANESMADLLHNNDFKPNDFYHDGMVDVDGQLRDISWMLEHEYETETEDKFLRDIYEQGAVNIFYKQRTYTKTVVYYKGNDRIGSKDLFFTLNDIQEANSLADLGLDITLYQTDDYKAGRLLFNEQLLVQSDIKGFIDAPSPVVVYDEFTIQENPDVLYVNYYRGGAYDNTLITLSDDPNYLDCNLTGRVMNPNGAIKYSNHYHTALYEDETQDYFIAYQVKVDLAYVDIHKGPGRAYSTLATITDKGIYTVIEVNRGWGRLREYPNGWILLSYTTPVTGPGQNPAFEIGGLNDVTIPFGTIVSFTKMTVDRLWAYSTEQGAWIKTEEISMNQQGRLYQALGTYVVHLNEIEDWSQITSIEDLGFSKNTYRLKYHDSSSFNYTGEFTYAALSAVHSIDIVYPETIYAYNVHYYKDTVKTITVQNGELVTAGTATVKNHLDPSIAGRNMYENPSTRSRVLKEIPAAQNQQTLSEVSILSFENPSGWRKISYEGIEGYLESRYIKEILAEPEFTEPATAINPEIGIASFSCSMSDWNPDWDIFIETSWQYDENNDPINPTLYRDTPLTLTWEFFEMDRNLYKPTIGAYDDGLFLWNPRSWDNENVYFTFEELVTTGSQSVLYLPTLDHYKAAYYLGFTTIPLDIENFSMKPKSEKDGHWDVEYKYENGFSWLPQTVYTNESVNFGYNRIGYLRNHSISNQFTHDSGTGLSSKTETYVSDHKMENDNPEYYLIENFSNKRNASSVWAEGNDLTNYQSDYITNGTIITETLNLENEDFYTFTYDQENSETPVYDHLSFIDQKIGTMQLYIVDESWTSVIQGSNYWFTQRAKEAETPNIYYYIKVWKDYFLQHYFIPLPKGYYLPDGRQVPYNTMYDVITNTLCEVTQIPYYASRTVNQGYTTTLSPVGYPQIFRVGSPVIKDNQFDYFNDWNNYSVTDVDYITKITTATISHKDPDVLAIDKNNLEVNLIIPVKGVTADAANKVKGEWYKSYDNSWFKSDTATILPSGTYTITPCDKYIAIKDTAEYEEPERNKVVTYYGYLNPAGDQATARVTTETAAHATAEHEDMYFIGNTWWPKSATEDNVEEIEVNYAVSADRLPVYSVPIAKDEYKVDMLLSGARITATKKLTYDNYWQYIGTGWVDIENNVSEVI